MERSDLDPVSRLALLVFRAQQALSADGDRLTAKWGLTSAKWKVLGAVALAGEAPSAAAIGRAMGLTRQAAIKQVRLLLDDGLLEQAVDPADARAPVHALSAGGRAAYAKASAAWDARATALSAGLRKADLESACAVLQTLVDRLDAAQVSGARRAGSARKEAAK